MASDDYIFSRNFHSSIRLNLNHWLFKGLAGYLLHPTIKCPKDASVADIGTGTAIWLQELAENLPPPAKLVGFDTSPEQFPAEALRMPNVTLFTHDCFEPFPPQHIGAYDVVAIRFFRCVVRNEDPIPLLKNAMTLLKPGGYLQWFDVLPEETAIYMPPGHQSTAMPMTEQLAKTSVCPAPDLSGKWVGRLPETFVQVGLEVVVQQRIPFRNAYRLPWAQSMLSGIEETSAKSGEEQMRQSQAFITGLSEEMAHGVIMDLPVLCIVGRKAA